MPDLLTEFDGHLASRGRGVMPTALDTEGLRDLGADVLARSVFTAHGISAIYASKLKQVIDQLASGEIGEGQARTALYECLDALGYTPEGGFPGEAGKVPPAIRGSLQDLRSFRRMNLVVRTQIDLMSGAGQQVRGMQPERLTEFPAYELVRVEDRETPRDWPARWIISGGQLHGGRMIAFKGDPVWGELGSYDNFQDALGVDHPPFAFQSGMGWKEISVAECDSLGIAGPNGESREVWFQGDIMVMAGKFPLPSPQLSMADVDPALLESFQTATHATSRPAAPQVMDFSDILASELKAGRDAYAKANPDNRP
jgi:hypothetical protein